MALLYEIACGNRELKTQLDRCGFSLILLDKSPYYFEIFKYIGLKVFI